MKKLLLLLGLAVSMAFSQPLPPCAVPTQTNPPCQAPALDQGVLSSAQVSGSANNGSPFNFVIPSTVQLTDDRYWASFPYEVQKAFRTISCYDHDATLCPPRTGNSNTFAPPSFNDTNNAAITLAGQGYQVDEWIMRYHNDPVVTMILRQNMGIPGVRPFGVPPGICTDFGPLCLKTSLNPADFAVTYPPAVASVQTTPKTNVIGGFEGTIAPGVFAYMPAGGNLYGAGMNAPAAYAMGLIADGMPYSENGVTYIAHVSHGLMGLQISFSVSN